MRFFSQKEARKTTENRDRRKETEVKEQRRWGPERECDAERWRNGAIHAVTEWGCAGDALSRVCVISCKGSGKKGKTGRKTVWGVVGRRPGTG